MYMSPLTRGFFEFVAVRGLRFGVLSDLYGVHLDREVLAPYDLHPSSLSTGDLANLGRVVGEKVRGEGFTTVVFVNGSPVRSVPYFKMLAASELTVLYTTRACKEDA